jgi:hypothetical protein
MSAHWRIKLTDDVGTFWLTDGERMWSDVPEDAIEFTCYGTAEKAALLARSRVARYIDWFPRVKIVKWSH